jgi:hypothetical protein
MLNNRQQTYSLLKNLGAPPRLIRHLQLVGEAADGLLQIYVELGIACDAQLVELGVAVHDAGKILHPGELDGPGSMHEPAGEAMLLAEGVQPTVAHCCVSHAAWAASGVTFEELTVALADKLWKGKREEALELLVIDAAAAALGRGRWELFAELDTAFERIAAGATDRLERSRVG